eukprot:5660502-Prymnesium_polylepis.1
MLVALLAEPCIDCVERLPLDVLLLEEDHAGARPWQRRQEDARLHPLDVENENVHQPPPPRSSTRAEGLHCRFALQPLPRLRHRDHRSLLQLPLNAGTAAQAIGVVGCTIVHTVHLRQRGARAAGVVEQHAQHARLVGHSATQRHQVGPPRAEVLAQCDKGGRDGFDRHAAPAAARSVVEDRVTRAGAFEGVEAAVGAELQVREVLQARQVGSNVLFPPDPQWTHCPLREERGIGQGNAGARVERGGVPLIQCRCSARRVRRLVQTALRSVALPERRARRARRSEVDLRWAFLEPSG